MHFSIQRTVDREFLRVCSPQMAYDWLAARIPEGRTRGSGSASDGVPELEAVLLDREDPLIDHGLARFGATSSVAYRLYQRLSTEGRKVMRACNRACGGPRDAFAELDPNEATAFNEISCWVTNPNLGDDLLYDAVVRSGPFSGLDDDHYQTMLRWLGRNPRFGERYDERFMDGYDDYSWHKPVKAAWDLAATVPTTKPWAATLSDLYEGMLPYTGGVGIEVVDRWLIDDEPKNPDQWFGRSPSFYLRITLAGTIRRVYDMLDAEDLAVRCAAYRTFDPASVKSWVPFIERDGAFFFQYALENADFWRRRGSREALGRVAWALPDPSSTMDHPNAFRMVEDRMRKAHPEWFEDEFVDSAEPMDPAPDECPRRTFRFGR